MYMYVYIVHVTTHDNLISCKTEIQYDVAKYHIFTSAMSMYVASCQESAKSVVWELLAHFIYNVTY